MADIEHSIEIAAKPEAVYALVATAKGFGEWWATDITEHDGAVELSFYNRSTVYRLRLVTEQAPAEAEWVCETGGEWKNTHILFRLAAAKSGTLLRFNHAGGGSASQYCVSCNTTWGELMFRVKSAAEGKSRGPLFLAAGMA